MTLHELYERLLKLPGHENLVLEEYRITQEVDDPGVPAYAHFYLTGPNTFYIFMTQIDGGHETTVEDYAAEVGVG